MLEGVDPLGCKHSWLCEVGLLGSDVLPPLGVSRVQPALGSLLVGGQGSGATWPVVGAQGPPRGQARVEGGWQHSLRWGRAGLESEPEGREVGAGRALWAGARDR